MLTGILRGALLLLVVATCGCADPPTAPPPPTPPPPNTTPPRFEPSIEGDYTLTLTASPSCSLPPEARRRSYTASVTEPSRGSITVELSGAVFITKPLPATFTPGFKGTRDGDALHFAIEFGFGMGVAELVDGTNELGYWGTAAATLGGRDITGSFNGLIYMFVAGGNPYEGIDCAATDHKIEFVRR